MENQTCACDECLHNCLSAKKGAQTTSRYRIVSNTGSSSHLHFLSQEANSWSSSHRHFLPQEANSSDNARRLGESQLLSLMDTYELAP